MEYYPSSRKSVCVVQDEFTPCGFEDEEQGENCLERPLQSSRCIRTAREIGVCVSASELACGHDDDAFLSIDFHFKEMLDPSHLLVLEENDYSV